MRILNAIFALIVATALTACQAGSFDAERSASDGSQLEAVAEAWDACCAAHNFDLCPAGIVQMPNDPTTMADLYNGSSFAADCDGLMLAMQNWLMVTLRPTPDVDDTIGFVLSDPAWN